MKTEAPHLIERLFAAACVHFARLNGWSSVYFLYHKCDGTFDGFDLRISTEHDLCARQLRLIELEMFVSSHGLYPRL